MKHVLMLAFLLIAVLVPYFVNAEEQAGITPLPMAAISMDLPFQDEDGKQTTLRQLAADRPFVLVPVLHNCPNICSIELADLLQAISFQPLRLGRDFTLVALSIDPRETPADAMASLDQIQAAAAGLSIAGVHALTGDAKSITKVTSELGYRYVWDGQNAQYIHVAAAAVMTPDGRLSQWLYGLSPKGATLQQALHTAKDETSGSWQQQWLLLCSHYEKLTGQYSNAVLTYLRVAGVGFCVVLVTMLLILHRNRHQRAGRG